MLILGTLAIDTITSPFGRAKEILGGSAAYAALAAAKFGKPAILSVVGRDFPPAFFSLFESFNVNTVGIERGEQTFRWTGHYDLDLSHPITDALELGDLRNWRPRLDGPSLSKIETEAIFLANFDPEIQAAVLEATTPTLCLLDSHLHWIERRRKVLEELIGKVTIFLANDAEARALTREANLIRAGRLLREAGPQASVIKKGEHGALLFTSEGTAVFGGYPLEEVRDPTGCGDAFAGAMLGVLVREKALSERALRRAVATGQAVASHVAEAFGVERLLTVTRAEIEERIEVFKRLSHIP